MNRCMCCGRNAIAPTCDTLHAIPTIIACSAARHNGVNTTVQPRKSQVMTTAGAWPASAGYPASTSLTRWSSAPHETNLYMELLTPGGALFQEMQMWCVPLGCMTVMDMTFLLLFVTNCCAVLLAYLRLENTL